LAEGGPPACGIEDEVDDFIHYCVVFIVFGRFGARVSEKTDEVVFGVFLRWVITWLLPGIHGHGDAFAVEYEGDLTTSAKRPQIEAYDTEGIIHLLVFFAGMECSGMDDVFVLFVVEEVSVRWGNRERNRYMF